MFDFLNGIYTGVYAAGTIPFTAGGWTSAKSRTFNANDTTTYTYILNFGKTFPVPPSMMFGCNSDYISSGQIFYPFTSYQVANTIILNGLAALATTQVSAAIGTSSLTFKITTVTGAPEYRMNMAYAIFQV